MSPFVYLSNRYYRLQKQHKAILPDQIRWTEARMRRYYQMSSAYDRIQKSAFTMAFSSPLDFPKDPYYRIQKNSTQQWQFTQEAGETSTILKGSTAFYLIAMLCSLMSRLQFTHHY